MIVDVARILVHQVLHLILVIEHQHQRNDGELAAGTRRQVPLSAPRIRIDGRNKRLYVTRLNGLARLGIHFAGILILRIVREVAADNKEVFVRKVRL